MDNTVFEELNNDSEQFFSVWKRVTSTEEKPEILQNSVRHIMEQLRGFITSEAHNINSYKRLRGIKTLNSIVEQRRETLKKLQSYYFLETGELVYINPGKMTQNGVLEQLRTQYWLEADGAKAYESAINGGCPEKLRLIYTKTVCEKRNAALELESLIEKLMT